MSKHLFSLAAALSLAALALCLTACSSGSGSGRATSARPTYEVPQACLDARNMQRTPNPDHDRIIELYTQCLKGNLSPKNRAVALLNRGNEKIRTDRWSEALSDLEASLAIHPMALAYNSRGVVKKHKGDLDGALADYDRALSLKPDYCEAHYNKGISMKSKGDLDAAVAEYTVAIECNPNYAKAYGNRAFVYKAQGRIDKAKADAARARELDPKAKVPSF